MISAAELEFLTEDEPIDIISSVAMERTQLIGGDVGPLEPGTQVQVPLWLAVNLRQRNKCRLLAPEWMNVVSLEEKRRQEQESKIFTAPPHEHYMEMTQLILSESGEDIEQADLIRTLVKDIWDTRVAKLRTSVDSMVQSEEFHAKLDNLTPMEINTVRGILVASMAKLQEMRKAAIVVPEDTQPTKETQSQTNEEV